MKKVVLAYSGGLDTSCIVRWLKDKGYEIICFVADLGQGLGQGESFEAIEERALAAGASKVYIKDLQDEFIDDFVVPALKANAIYEGKYLLATALGRPLIAKYLVQIAHKEKAQCVAHGCTGKGNDQVRFEVTAGILDPKLEILAPVREWEFKSREEEIEYAMAKNIPIDVTKKKPYSIDRNIWGISIEAGILENLEHEPPEDAYLITKSPAGGTTYPKYIEIYFEKGKPKKIDGKVWKLKDLINHLNVVGGTYGVGRQDLVENRLVGIKSREIYEAPAATILHIAHRELESLVLDRETAHFKEIIALKYSELVYYGLWYSPLKQALDGFVDSTQEFVTGSIKLKLTKGVCAPVSRKSPNSLYKKELSTYGKEDKFNQKLAEGFIKIWGMPYQR
ncbi:MAG: argininosuccinate synthase [Candidatus Omnitrophota bacterium]|nr:argininosuccinate synthase [Candidatus Omnitrophota bacterium]MBU1929417.1 argininosuccinate synthase [Candidatus Omnitrophota bacterium]MBU2034898.1 argininosuccinate synthase [Candidatus Omnitrophota bacterium]MBU2221302.1 argininosuccinate synthase [Candidatus Omnitrophota bacterium]MBU2257960.1 argininosuccinate synthase [Candidatus Omnitrophota bacterium]